MAALRSLGAQRHLTVQEKKGHVELRVEGEAEYFLLGVVPLRIVYDGVVGGAECLDESVARGHAGVGVGRN